MATKLNEMTQVFFLCSGSDRGGFSLGYEEEDFGPKRLFAEAQAQAQDSWASIFSRSEDESNEDDAIEIDTEVSLRPAYELYRV